MLAIDHKPIIGIILDENTSQGATAYEAGKGYFRAIERAGGIGIGLSYSPDSVLFALRICAGLLSTGARIQFPADWYRADQTSQAPQSERFEIERALVEAFLLEDRPYLGICNGMQMLACLTGSLMSGDIARYTDGTIPHDDPTTRHEIDVIAGTKLHAIIGKDRLIVNSFHRECVVEVGAHLKVSAYSIDGIIEAVERADKSFALGIQWHGERLLDESEDAQAVFSAFVQACRIYAQCA
ncbi:gamma-glutamyl-gamma-aminobutyrate hydrolase family protein [Candidatus Phycosocius spiralis]|uniref:gamma-glutamyl-gamma-aminobutyrate hydrolase family protein n=1 Tax=Candidatus Phycosocius spiralis TaxID=2815099 RepID=UPI0024E0690B|nr:gamma-glutamyl-gamma-aminobutyrate hydrolase family protein [Candidatus Phycosocius spiralis]